MDVSETLQKVLIEKETLQKDIESLKQGEVYYCWSWHLEVRSYMYIYIYTVWKLGVMTGTHMKHYLAETQTTEYIAKLKGEFST